MIVSKDNEKLKLVRRLQERKHREREGLFAAEGEDLLDAGLAAGLEPELVLSVAGSGLGGVEVAPEALASASTLGSGTRVISIWRQRWSQPAGPVCVYLHGVGDPRNVGAVIRSAHALVEGSVALSDDSADPYSPTAVRASMGSVFAVPLTRGGIDATPRPRVALVAHGGSEPRAAAGPLTLCVGSERKGMPAELVEGHCEEAWTIALRPDGAESLNLAAAAAIALGRISSARRDASPDEAEAS
jgi:TrmH family RNA methyltransferase